MRLRHWEFFLLCVFLLASLPSFGAAAPLGGLKVCLLPLADLTPAGRDITAYTAIISDDLRLELEEAGVSMVPMGRVQEIVAKRSVPARALLEPRTAVSAAMAAGGEVALSGYIALIDDTLLVSLRAYDVTTGILLAGLLQSYQFDISLYSRLWQDVLEMLAQAVIVPGQGAATELAAASGTATASPAAAASGAARVLPAAAASGEAPTLTFTSRQEGIEVLLPDGKSLGRIVNGRLAAPAEGVDFRYPIVIEKRLDGYHGSRQAVKGAGVVALSPLAPESGFAVEADWTTGQLLGLGTALRVYLSPDALFVAPAVYVSGQPPPGPAGNAAFHVDTEIRIGMYLFFPPESPIRFGVSAGAGAIFSWVQSTSLPVFFDPYVDVASLWLETSLPWFAITLGSDLKYTLGGQTPNLLGQGMILWAGFLPPVSLGVVFKW